MTTTSTTPAAPAKVKLPLKAKVLIAVVFFVVLSAAVAVAAIISSLSLGGSVRKGQFEAIYDTAFATVVDPADNYKEIKSLPKPTITDKKKVTLASGTTAFFGEAIELTVGVKPDPDRSANKRAYVSGITMPSALPAGWDMSIVEGCGIVSYGGEAGPKVKIRMEPSETATSALSLEGMKIIVTTLPDSPTLPTGTTVPNVTCDLKVG